MSNGTVRKLASEDEKTLTVLWKNIFGDDEALIGKFFRLLPEMGIGFAAECDGKAVGMAYLITGMELVGEAVRQIGYLYAVAVDEKYRGHGIGERLVLAAEAECKTRGLLFATEPADGGLCVWYEKLCGMKKVLFRGSVSIQASAGELREISAAEYLSKREAFLGGIDHVRLSSPTLEFEYALCCACAGGFYADDSGIAAGYPEKGSLKICELLGDEKLAAAAAYRLGCESAEILSSAGCGEHYISAKEAFPGSTVWNLSFD